MKRFAFLILLLVAGFAIGVACYAQASAPAGASSPAAGSAPPALFPSALPPLVLPPPFPGPAAACNDPRPASASGPQWFTAADGFGAWTTGWCSTAYGYFWWGRVAVPGAAASAPTGWPAEGVDLPVAGPAIWRTPPASSRATYTLYTTAAGKLAGVVPNRKATPEALCDCAAPIASGSSTYCPLAAGSPAEVTLCRKVSQ